MRIHIAVLLLLLMKCAFAFAEEACEQLTHPDMTVSQFVEAQISKSKNSFAAPNSDPNKCFPEAKTTTILGMPVCYLNYLDNLIPVRGITVSAIQDKGVVDVALYMMRGTQRDLDSVLNYFNKKYVNITDYYLKGMKGPKFFGITQAWKNKDQYIVLGQHEPGYAPEEMSLQLTIGSKDGIEFIGTDLNTCK